MLLIIINNKKKLHQSILQFQNNKLNFLLILFGVTRERELWRPLPNSGTPLTRQKKTFDISDKFCLTFNQQNIFVTINKTILTQKEHHLLI